MNINVVMVTIIVFLILVIFHVRENMLIR
jgi:hypothetical protein